MYLQAEARRWARGRVGLTDGRAFCEMRWKDDGAADGVVLEGSAGEIYQGMSEFQGDRMCGTGRWLRCFVLDGGVLYYCNDHAR